MEVVRMAHSIKQQIFESISSSFCPSESKHLMKSQGFHNYGEKIFSYSSMNRLKDVGSDFAKFIKENYNIKQVKDIKEVHCQAYLQSKIDNGCTSSTIKSYAQSIQKLGKCCLYHFGEKTQIDWKTDKTIYESNKNIGETAKIRTLSMDKNDFEKAIERGRDCQSKEALKVCWAFGLRSEEVVSIKIKDIRENSLVVSNAKGGRLRELDADTSEKKIALEKLKNFCDIQNRNPNESVFSIKKNSVNDYLQTNLRREGITKYNDAKTGIHSIRKSFANREYERLRGEGLSHKDAWGRVLNELGHGRDRMELFKIYVGKV